MPTLSLEFQVALKLGETAPFNEKNRLGVTKQPAFFYTGEMLIGHERGTKKKS